MRFDELAMCLKMIYDEMEVNKEIGNTFFLFARLYLEELNKMRESVKDLVLAAGLPKGFMRPKSIRG